MVVVYILLFIVCLSTLIMIHELGHLCTAKMFKVYCFEYSIGFGPKLFSKKRKNGETYFSLRAIPFGGFVSMYGEAETVPEGLEIDKSRSLESIKKWKKIIIMLAGVTMNFVLALLIFFVYEVGFPKYIGHYGHILVNHDSIAYSAGLRSGDPVYAMISTYDADYIFYDSNAVMSYEDHADLTDVYVGFSYSSLTIKNTSLVNHIVVYDHSQKGSLIDSTNLTIGQIRAGEYSLDTDYVVEGYITGLGTQTIDDKQVYLVQVVENYGETYETSVIFKFENYLDYKEMFKYLGPGISVKVKGKISDFNEKYKCVTALADDFMFTVPDYEKGNLLSGKLSGGYVPNKLSYSLYVTEQTPSGKGTQKQIIQNVVPSGDAYKLEENPGINMQIEEYRTDYCTSVKNTFTDFADSATIIGRSLGQLFTNANAWKDVGGIIAVGVYTTRTLEESGFGAFLYYWAMISVNLAIVNLLPFPGLDGWHCLVTIVEGVSRKELPKKFKTIMSAIGLVILFALMIAIVIKDIVTFI